jgi:hypothetical protein
MSWPRGRSLGRAGGQRAPALVGEPLEAIQVKLTRLDAQPVSAGRRGEPAAGRPERTTHAGDRDLERLVGAGGRASVPQLLDQAIARDRRAALEQEQREERALPGAGGSGSALRPS